MLRRHLGLFVFLLVGACATDQAAQLRTERPHTIALWGYTHRPAANIGIGLTAQFQGAGFDSDVTINRGETSEKDVEIKRSQGGISAFAQYFFWDTSAFFVGGGIEALNTEVKFDQETLTSTAQAKQTTRIAYTDKDVYLVVPIGWAWIWDNGFSFQLDLGPRFRLSRKRNYDKNGEGLVDVKERDDISDEAERFYNGRIRYGGSTVFGYSF